MNNPLLPSNLRQAMAIIQNAGDENGWMSEEEYKRNQAELRKLGVITMQGGQAQGTPPLKDKHGRTFFEVSIHPFVEQVADGNGEPVEGDWSNTSGGEFSEEFGDDLDGYPDAMFRKGWSVSSWVRDHDGDIDVVDEEEFPDYDTAIIRAEELAAQYRVGIDHRY